MSFRGPFSVVAALVPPAQKMTKRSRHTIDEVLKFEGASSTIISRRNRALALAAVRHQKSSLAISAQDNTQFDVKGQENLGQASGDRLHISGVQALGDRWRMVQPSDVRSLDNQLQFPGFTGNPDVTVPKVDNGRIIIG